MGRYRAARPVVIVGNITVGGSGKTPFTIWLARWLSGNGYRPGIILRGYRGNSAAWPVVVTPRSDPDEVGDEAVLLALGSGAPVVAGPDRGADCELLLERFDCDVILSDDGLQHLALERDFEIVLHQPGAGEGNGWCLPAGPLREPLSRLRRADLVVVYGDSRLGITATPGQARPLSGAGAATDLDRFRDKRVFALTAIARPDRFFEGLRRAGLSFDHRALPDHHRFLARDIPGSEYDVILVTEKDAVKLSRYDDSRIFAVGLNIEVAPAVTKQLENRLLSKLQSTWSSSTS
jgi:tetraacyldisaccharide 4'-kinase